jgi:hypothetical protein
MLSEGKAQIFLPGQILYSQGDVVDVAFLILQGQVSLDSKGADRTLHFGIRKTPEYLVEFEFVSQFLSDSKYWGRAVASFTATALTDTIVMPMTVAEFKSQILDNPDNCQSFLAIIAGQCKKAFDVDRGSLWLTGPELVARHLMGYLERFEVTSEDPLPPLSENATSNDFFMHAILRSSKATKRMEILSNSKMTISLKTLKSIVPGNPRMVERAVDTLEEKECLTEVAKNTFSVNIQKLRDYVTQGLETETSSDMF